MQTMSVLKKFASCVAIVCLMPTATLAQPQGAFDWCGTLEEFEGCVALYAIWPGPLGPHVLTDYGSFGPGDQVHVVGEYMGQYTTCGTFEDVPVVSVSTIEVCALDYCGDLFEFRGCLVFNGRDGSLFGLSDYGPYGPGDVIRITGAYVAGYQLVCDRGARFPIIEVVSAEPCTLESCCRGLVDGDLNMDGMLDLADLLCLVRYVFIAPDPGCCLEEANVNDSPGGFVDLSDVLYLVNYLFLGGPPPVFAPCLGP